MLFGNYWSCLVNLHEFLNYVSWCFGPRRISPLCCYATVIKLSRAWLPTFTSLPGAQHMQMATPRAAISIHLATGNRVCMGGCGLGHIVHHHTTSRHLLSVLFELERIFISCLICLPDSVTALLWGDHT